MKRKLNEKLLEEVMDCIKAEPRKLDMNLVAEKVNADNDPIAPPCGTVGCIAGWALLLSGHKRLAFKSGHNSLVKAAKILGLEGDGIYRYNGYNDDEAESVRLFHVDAWPDKFAEAYEDAESDNSPRRKATATIKRIKHFINTRE
jgi:hypothetical protein